MTQRKTAADLIAGLRFHADQMTRGLPADPPGDLIKVIAVIKSLADAMEKERKRVEQDSNTHVGFERYREKYKGTDAQGWIPDKKPGFFQRIFGGQ